MTLPTTLPDWYGLAEDNPEKGWTPQTTDIKERIIQKAWETGDIPKPASDSNAVRIDRLKIISPIQVGGGSFKEGHILPAQIGGVPCIPGSSLRGALLAWLQKIWKEIRDEPEREFWNSLLDRSGKPWKWLPRAIRFENVPLTTLQAYPLHPQQSWQLKGEKGPLAVQWQAAPEHPEPAGGAAATSFATARARPGARGGQAKPVFEILLDRPPTKEEKKWLQERLTEMLQRQGIGRGTASGFGRLAAAVPQKGMWQIELKGAKPSQSGSEVPGKNKKYRWTPQVLRANLRGYFTRLALPLLGQQKADKLTSIIFGGIPQSGRPTTYVGELVLTSYLSRILSGSDRRTGDYKNIPMNVAEETWIISVNCAAKFQGNHCPKEGQGTVEENLKELVGALLDLASRLGGLGSGWRRPPHSMRGDSIFRGSQFTVTPASSKNIPSLISRLQAISQELAEAHRISLEPNPNIQGRIVSIWRSENPSQWRDIVHGICASNANSPNWCGGQNKPSGYSVREHEDYCLITVFDPDVERTLRKQGFQKIWPIAQPTRP